MDLSLAIGDYQNIAFPAPIWLMQLLLVLGFFIHALPMNVALMGGLTAAALMLYGRANNHEYSERAGKSLAVSLPIFTTLAITNGIVPLLFLQVMYGPVVYISSIIMAAPWMLVLLLLLLGYYGFYIYAYQKKILGDKAPWVLIASSLLFLGIAFLFTNNMTLMLTPEKFVDMYEANRSGFNLNLTEPTLIPRLSHFVLAATAVTGLVLGCFGWYHDKRDPDYSKWLIHKSASLFVGITLLQVLVGGWFLFSLPGEMTQAFLGGNMKAAGPFYLAMALDVVALVAMALAAAKRSLGAFKVGFFAALGLILAMVATRHELRVMMLDGIVNPATHPVEPQWFMLGLFGLITVIFGAMFVWLGKITWRAFHPNEA